MRLIELKEKDLKEACVPFTRGTLYVWNSTGKHPELFVKLGKKVLFNYNEFELWAESEIEKSKKKGEKK